MSGLGIERKAKTFKMPQQIWVEGELFAWIVTEATKLGMAPNTFIVEVLRKAREFCERGSWSPIITKEVVKVEKVTKAMCPACLKEFDDTMSFIEHVKRDKLHVYQWLKEVGLVV